MVWLTGISSPQFGHLMLSSDVSSWAIGEPAEESVRESYCELPDRQLVADRFGRLSSMVQRIFAESVDCLDCLATLFATIANQCMMHRVS